MCIIMPYNIDIVRGLNDQVKMVYRSTSIKEYLFVEIHDLGDGRISRFDSDFAIAQSWMRLVERSDIKRHDLTLIRHEIMERDLKEDGFSQDDAHIITSQVYNYHKESDEYYDKDPKYQ